MRNEAECLGKASELEARARECPDGQDREAFLAMALDWRRLAAAAAAAVPPR